MLILTLVLTGMMQVFRQGFSISRKSKERSCAYDLTLRTMEEYSNWSALVALAGSDPPTNGTYTPASVSLNGITYTRSIVVSNGPVYATQLKQIVATITWSGTSFSLQSYVANY